MENRVPDFCRLEKLFKRQNYNVDARILDGCNFDCIYCSDDLKKKHDVQYVTADFLNEFASFVFQTKNQYLNLNLTGGEPLLHPEFERIVQTPYVNHLSITTNFSKNVNLLKDYDSFISTIAISVHRPYWRKWTSVLKKIKHYGLDTKKIFLTVMYWPNDQETVNEIRQFYTENRDKLGGFTVRRIRTKNQWNEQTHYSEDDLNFLLKNSNENNSYYDVEATYPDGKKQKLNTNQLMTEKLWNFRGWYCRSIHEGCLLIPGNQIQNGNCNQTQMNFEQFKQMIESSQTLICKRPRCFCTFDLKFTKWRSNIGPNQEA